MHNDSVPTMRSQLRIHDLKLLAVRLCGQIRCMTYCSHRCIAAPSRLSRLLPITKTMY